MMRNPRRACVGLLFVLALGHLGCQDKAREQSTPPQPAVAPTPSGPNVDVVPKASNTKGDQTFEYWRGISKAQDGTVREYALRGDAKLDDVVRLLNALAQSIETLPARGVDPDAIDAAHDVADSMRRMANFIQRNVNAAAALNSAARSLLFGDTSVFGEQAADARDLRNRLENAAAKARKMRALLSSRYDREFPSLDAPRQKKEGEPNPLSDLRAATALTAVPPQKEIAQLRNEVKLLDKEIISVVEQLAKEIVSIKDLEVKARALSGQQNRDKEALTKLADAIKSADGTLTLGNRTITVEAAKAELADHVKRFEANQKALDSMGQVLTQRGTIRDALEKQLETLKNKKTELIVALDALETDLMELKLQQTDGKIQIDDTRLLKIKEDLRKLQAKMNAEREKLKLMPSTNSPANGKTVDDILKSLDPPMKP